MCCGRERQRDMKWVLNGYPKRKTDVEHAMKLLDSMTRRFKHTTYIRKKPE